MSLLDLSFDFLVDSGKLLRGDADSRRLDYSQPRAQRLTVIPELRLPERLSRIATQYFAKLVGWNVERIGLIKTRL